jgi:hypothetical protein
MAENSLKDVTWALRCLYLQQSRDITVVGFINRLRLSCNSEVVQEFANEGITLYDSVPVGLTNQWDTPVLHVLAKCVDPSVASIQLSILERFPPQHSVEHLSEPILRIVSLNDTTCFLPFFLRHGLRIEDALLFPLLPARVCVEPRDVAHQLIQYGARVADDGPLKEQIKYLYTVRPAIDPRDFMRTLRMLVYILNMTPNKCCIPYTSSKTSKISARLVYAHQVMPVLLCAVSGLRRCGKMAFPEVDLSADVLPSRACITTDCPFALAVLLGDPDIMAHRASGALSTRQMLREADKFVNLSAARRELAFCIMLQELNRPTRAVFSVLHSEKRKEIVTLLLVEKRLSREGGTHLPFLPFELWELVGNFIRWW